MIRSPLALRLNPGGSIRDQIREAATLGAKGVVLDATGDLSPDRLSETGRRELRYLLRSVEAALVALNLPTRRPFDTLDELDDRLRRAEKAFGLAFELGTSLVLARVGPFPPESDAARRETWLGAVRELGRRADHRGVRLAIETGPEPGSVLRPVLDSLDTLGLAASIDPASLLVHGVDPAATTRELGTWVAHAYANDSSSTGSFVSSVRPGATGFAPGSLDWAEYLGALEEINYRGYLTIWPDPAHPASPQFTAMVERLKRF